MIKINNKVNITNQYLKQKIKKMTSNSYPLLYSEYQLGNIILQNRIVMSPMTRSRAIDNVPNHLMETYYRERAGAGLIITEGVAPSPNGVGYPRIPGLYNQEQVEGWKKVTGAVHDNGGRIFVQLMHTGRITHPLNLPEDAEVVSASAIAAAQTKMYTDQEGMQPLPVPRKVSKDEIAGLVAEFAQSAAYAIEAGFDGVELHGANGYLLEQFLNSASNKRTDDYGGSLENRNRFVLEVAQAVADVIGKEKLGIRLSPYGVFNDIVPDDTTDQQYE